jgi:hypothetical protein
MFSNMKLLIKREVVPIVGKQMPKASCLSSIKNLLPLAPMGLFLEKGMLFMTACFVLFLVFFLSGYTFIRHKEIGELFMGLELFKNGFTS